LSQDWHTRPQGPAIRTAEQGSSGTRRPRFLIASVRSNWRWLHVVLVWIGLFALFRGISEIVSAFEVRSRQRG
jgi:hypothetical protein